MKKTALLLTLAMIVGLTSCRSADVPQSESSVQSISAESSKESSVQASKEISKDSSHESTVQTSEESSKKESTDESSQKPSIPESSVQASEKESTPGSAVQASEKESTPESSVQASEKESTPESSVQVSEKENTPESSVQSSVPEQSESPKTQPVKLQDNGIFSEYYDQAYQTLLDMTLDEKIGQMLYARCPDYDAVEIAQQYHLGGYVLFGRDFADKSRKEVKNNIDSYVHSQKIPMTIAVDEEGGTVVRISSKPALYDHEFESPRDIFAQGGMKAIKSNASAMADMIADLGIDVNFAPVCDISVNEDDFMYYRSLGEDVDTTCEFVRQFVSISQGKGVSASLKHFPGYGNNVDTHTGIAIDERSYETFRNTDFKPFQAGIEANAHIVMVSHNIVNCMDSTKPASLSPKVHEILRNELGFTGIAVTDDLEMDAITEYTGGNSPAVAAILAGNDMLTIGDTMLEDAVDSIKTAVYDGTINESLIDCAVTRILAWKYSKNMM